MQVFKDDPYLIWVKFIKKWEEMCETFSIQRSQAYIVLCNFFKNNPTDLKT